MRYAYLLLLFVGVNSFAKDDDLPKHKLFEGRLTGGFNFAQMAGDSYGGFHKVGLNAGGMVYVHYKQVFGVSLELLYSQKGVRGGNIKESYTVGTYFDKYYVNLDYTEACLMLHFDRFFFDYEAGISYGQLVKSSEWAEADVPIVIKPEWSYFNSYDINYVAGLSCRLDRHWAVNARYTYSSTPIRPRERVYPRYSDGSAGQFNEAFCLRLMYTFK